jgi:hypothetical protein
LTAFFTEAELAAVLTMVVEVAAWFDEVTTVFEGASVVVEPAAVVVVDDPATVVVVVEVVEVVVVVSPTKSAPLASSVAPAVRLTWRYQ